MRYWMVYSKRTPEGPFEQAELERRILAEGVEPSRLVCPEGGQAWIEARDAFPALFAAPPLQPNDRFGSVHLADAGESIRLDDFTARRRAPPTTPPAPSSIQLPLPEGRGALAYLVPIGVEPCSFAAGYLGILSLFGGCAAPFAFGFGIAGLVRLRRRPHLRGHVRCAFGFLGGLLGLGIGALLLIASSR